ncbi:hypothetical protein TPHA_0E03520 [Tetrapisispora phaffii CBS 4417]|uniref:Sugar phosphate transporter domain-containing protein n=1 Tax=Tetrapisispora phaffii (strain ATCC 24235 / CBS 4417 / NBRC 1672 / NRRL Y-8282 / UCD 70-5) TaxID=1071381 RepID=G8BU64_TETPH|nr:hypothetical protein TPHA_0E03520 [Tetrapisispora phaffii CBS 4417]CCE63442.1 hypothetical protein TPHA_0E03520 [Tetrapisispora phaffii CBS 4417]
MPHNTIKTLYNYIHIVILCVCWYMLSSVGSQVTKRILTVCPLPLFLGEFQFLYTAQLAVLCCGIAYSSERFYNTFPNGTFPVYDRKNIRDNWAWSVITKPSKSIFQTVLPLSIFQFVGKFFGHKATSLVPVSTVASIKTLSPVFILIFQKIIGISTIQTNINVGFSLAALITGVWIIVSEDNKLKSSSNVSDFSLFGIICAVISMFIFVFQNIYGKKVFTFKKDDDNICILPKVNSTEQLMDEKYAFGSHHKISNKCYDKLTLMLYISSVGFILSFFWFITFELPTILRYLSGDTTTVIQSIPWQLFIINGTFHFLQAMITFHLLGELSTLTYSIANLMKRIAIISVSWVFIGKSVTLMQIFGLFLNVVGLFVYERIVNKNKKPRIHEK